ncbi:MAG: hypothetical protein F4Y24_14065 [Gemmatimonadetes bacterium]|nr:hypothetical protein [Gemmatimonadota bacterium]MYG21106.1 hypothetical protein [Gemmatimonadota bacterium]MYJ40184.1 hypothetical protein [Gemmatimonadota bacterium]
MRIQRAALAALLSLMGGCSDSTAKSIAWPGLVEAELDHITGASTGMFRTQGPTQLLTAGRDTIPVTLGYWCQVNQNSEPGTAIDGLFFRVAMLDTFQVSDNEEAFEGLGGKLGLLGFHELSDQLGLPNVAPLAVDGWWHAWHYQPTPAHWGWLLNGTMGFRPPVRIDTEVERDSLLQNFEAGYRDLADVARRPLQEVQAERVQGVGDSIETSLRSEWSAAHDYVRSHYVGRDTLAIELAGVLNFPMAGFDAAVDSVRFRCPVPQSHHEWDSVRTEFFAVLDSLRMAPQRRVERRLDSISVASLVARRILSADLARAFVEYARENAVNPVARVDSLDNVSRVCNIWRTLTELEQRQLPGLQNDALERLCDWRLPGPR